MRSSIQIEGKDGRLQEVGVICPPDPETPEGQAEIALLNAQFERILARKTMRVRRQGMSYAYSEGQSVKKSDQNIT